VNGGGRRGGSRLPGLRLERDVVVDRVRGAAWSRSGGASGVARTLGEATDLLAGEGDAVVASSVLLPTRLLEGAGGADEVAGLKVPLDIGLARVVEDGDLVPAGALLPFAVVVLVGVGGGDGDAERRADCLDLPDAADDLESAQ
jgi:hypothetical protein